jgi:hypothetical protein
MHHALQTLSPAMPQHDCDKQGMAATASEGTAPKRVLVNAGEPCPIAREEVASRERPALNGGNCKRRGLILEKRATISVAINRGSNPPAANLTPTTVKSRWKIHDLASGTVSVSPLNAASGHQFGCGGVEKESRTLTRRRSGGSYGGLKIKSRKERPNSPHPFLSSSHHTAAVLPWFPMRRVGRLILEKQQINKI